MSELQDAIDWWDSMLMDPEGHEPMPVPEGKAKHIHAFVDAARRVANPETNADIGLAHRFDTMRVGGPTADGRVHLNGSLSNDEWGRLQAALGFTTEDTK